MRRRAEPAARMVKTQNGTGRAMVASPRYFSRWAAIVSCLKSWGGMPGDCKGKLAWNGRRLYGLAPRRKHGFGSKEESGPAGKTRHGAQGETCSDPQGEVRGQKGRGQDEGCLQGE